MNKTLHHRLSALALGIAALALSACSTAPLRPAEPALPAQWQQTASPAATQDAAHLPSWEDLADPGLVALQQQVLAANLDLKQSALRLQSSATALGLKDLRLTPSLSGSYSGSRPLQSSGPSYVNVGGQQVPIPSNDRYSASWSLSAGVSWELDLFGRLRSLREQALEEFFASEAAQRSTQVSLIASVANAWLTLSADQAQLALARDTSKSLNNRTAALFTYKQLRGAASTQAIAAMVSDPTIAALALRALGDDLTQARSIPINVVTGANSGDNLGPGTPTMHFDQWENEDEIEVKLLLKGGGEVATAQRWKTLADDERETMLDDLRRRTINPTRIVYYWLVPDPAVPGNLMRTSQSVSIPAPSWTVTPPANPALPPVVAAEVPAPADTGYVRLPT